MYGIQYICKATSQHLYKQASYYNMATPLLSGTECVGPLRMVRSIRTVTI